MSRLLSKTEALRPTRRTCWRTSGRGSVVACCALATLAVAAGASRAGAQGRYPASNAGAPPGVYSAPRIVIDSLTAMVQKDSLDYGANWRLSQALATLGALAGDAGRIDTRDSFYRRAATYARRAVRLAPNEADGQYALAKVLERFTAEASMRDRVGLSKEILAASEKALKIDPSHDGAWHLLGRWHMAVWRLSPLERFVSVKFFGGQVMVGASLEEGLTALEKAVSLRPNCIQYRLDLARAYLDGERAGDAQAQLDAIASLQPNDPEDAIFLREAARLSEWLTGRN
jgi:tetratricopeptide (TPR) repeat protein